MLKNINNNSEISKTINFFTLSELIKLSYTERSTKKTDMITIKNNNIINIQHIVTKRYVYTENINKISNTNSKSISNSNKSKIISKERKTYNE